MNKKIGVWILIILIIIQFPIILFLFNSKSTAFDMDFYEKEFAKYEPDVKNSVLITENLIYYLRYKDADEKHINVFEQDEKEHLIDVKVVMHRFMLFLNLVLLSMIVFYVVLFYIEKKSFLKNFSLSLFFGGVFSLVVLLFFKFAITDFNGFFNRFHDLFFAKGTWTFPIDSKLVTLFPREFWVDIAGKIIGDVLASANILILAAVILFLIYKRRSRK